MSEHKSASYGIGFPGLLTILFIYLKLTHQIEWSWWWVWSPIWIAGIVTLTILVPLLFILAIIDKKP